MSTIPFSLLAACAWVSTADVDRALDHDGDGFVALAYDGDDCDDADPDVHPGAAERCDGAADEDCDGVVDEDDALGAQTWYADLDADGFGDPAAGATSCAPADGAVSDDSDCDDSNAAISPDATETCDDVDQDCDGAVDDDGADAGRWYRDEDGDGFGTDVEEVVACEAPDGYAASPGDCDDTDDGVHPGATEPDCSDPVDYNCDGSTGYADADADGFAACQDCDDTTPERSPGATEVCDAIDQDCDGAADEDFDADGDGQADCFDAEECDGLDNDGDGEVDEGDASNATTWYQDADGDGSGDPTRTVVACAAPPGYTADASDCDDTTAAVSPSSPETCDGIDEDCDGEVDEADAADAATWYADADGDGDGDGATGTTACEAPAGTVATSGDCDDSDPAVSSAGTESCNGIDDDCDGDIDGFAGAVWFIDADGDGAGQATAFAVSTTAPSGYVATADDCDDADGAIAPVPAPEAWWRFEDGAGSTAADETGGGAVDASGARWVSGQVGGALEPSGSTAVATESRGPFSALTLSAWAWLDTTGGEQAILSSYGSAEGLLRWGVADGQLVLAVGGERHAGGALAAGGWHHVATTLDAMGSVQHYVDGVLQATGTIPGAPSWSLLTPTVGAWDLGGGLPSNQMDGLVDELMVFASALDATQIGSLHASGSAGEIACVTRFTTPAPSSVAPSWWYPDTDGDGYGDGDGAPALACAATAGAVGNSDDCNDAEPTAYPGANETCDGSDQDCDTLVDEYGASDALTWYTDGDGDGVGSSDGTLDACTVPGGFASLSGGIGDCDDADPGAFPGNQEVCDGTDDDCDGEADWGKNVPADYATLQAAHDHATDGDTICVAAGTYDPVTITGTNLTLEGYGGRDATVVDGGGAEKAVTVYHAAGTTIRGFTLRNGCCGSGSGIEVDGGSNVWIDDVVVRDNVGYSGGGVRLNSSSTTLTGVDILSNYEAGDSAEGVGLWVASGSLVMQNVRIIGNVAEVSNMCSGAGAYLWNVDDGLSLTNVIVAGNRCSASDGEAITRAAGVLTIGTDLSLVNVAIAGNFSDPGAGYSDGIGWYSEGGAITVVNGINTWNSASTAPSYGGWSGDSTTAWAFSYSDTWGNDGADYFGSNPTGVDGNVSEDPGLADLGSVDPEDWDLALGTGSPLVDVGDPLLFDSDGTRSDVGAYGGAGGADW